MKIWTKQAEERLAEYLESRTRRDGLKGVDAREMKEDLTAHIHEEVWQLEAETVGTAEVESVFTKLEDGHAIEVPALPKRGRGWLMFFGVILPLVVTIFEMLSGFCASTFFDPVPTWKHSIMVLSVPLLNWWLMTAGQRAASHWQGMAAGVSVVVSTIYALLFLPLLPASVIALIAYGLGMLSLMPLILWFMSRMISKRSRAVVTRPWRFRKGWWAGGGLAMVLFLLLEGPGMWTRWHLSNAVSQNPELADRGLENLRSYHSESTLLRACYEGNRGTAIGTNISGWLRLGWNIPLTIIGNPPKSPNSQAVRDVFFRATGKPFNSVPPPGMVSEGSLFGGRGRARAFEDFEFDDHLGGDAVAVRLRGLDLTESRFDGHVDTVSQIGYGEWTMVFSNTSSQAKEARCQVRLPRGGRVSRLTLWVNGEPREAAFNSVEKVKAAYREIAVKQRRDPVLVTMAGPDTVMVQCFPVPAQGEMKIRFGVTASLDGGLWELPRIVERNFGLGKKTEHALWLQADQGFDVRGVSDIVGSAKDGAGFSTNAAVDMKQTLGMPMAMSFKGIIEQPEVVWCEDQFADEGAKFLERKSSMQKQSPVDKLIVVIDGSASMSESAEDIEKVFAENFSKVQLIIADDDVRYLDLNGLSSYHFSGGRDNEPALRKAVSLAKESDHGAVLWLHGPQAVELTKSEALRQLLERGKWRPKFYEVEVAPGPNRMSEALGKVGLLERGPTMYDLRKDLKAFVADLLEGGPKAMGEWRRAASMDELTGKKVWNHLARIWAIERSESEDSERAKIAAKYQLVTPVSGAVVLETMEQFERHGLVPVDVTAAPSIPGVPEPSISLLILMGMAAGLGRRRRKIAA